MFLRKFVGFADEFQIVVRTVLPHHPHQVTELGDGEDVGRDLLAQSRHIDYSPLEKRPLWRCWRAGEAIQRDLPLACFLESASTGASELSSCRVPSFSCSSQQTCYSEAAVSAGPGTSFGQRSFRANRGGAVAALQEHGYQVTRLVRGAKSGATQIGWDPRSRCGRNPSPASTLSFIWRENPSSAAGPRRRSAASSTAGCRAPGIGRSFGGAPKRRRVLITASAIGYYGDRGDELLTEDSSPAKVFCPWSAANGKPPRSPRKRPAFAPRKSALAWC